MTICSRDFVSQLYSGACLTSCLMKIVIMLLFNDLHCLPGLVWVWETSQLWWEADHSTLQSVPGWKEQSNYNKMGVFAFFFLFKLFWPDSRELNHLHPRKLHVNSVSSLGAVHSLLLSVTHTYTCFELDKKQSVESLPGAPLVDILMDAERHQRITRAFTTLSRI